MLLRQLGEKFGVGCAIVHPGIMDGVAWLGMAGACKDTCAVRCGEQHCTLCRPAWPSGEHAHEPQVRWRHDRSLLAPKGPNQKRSKCFLQHMQEHACMHAC